METGRAVLALGYVQGVAKKCSFPERIGKRMQSSKRRCQSPSTCLLEVSICPIPEKLRSEWKVEAGKLPTSHYGCFCTRERGQTAQPYEPVSLSTAAAAGPPGFPSPSFREVRQDRSGPQRP